MVFQYEACTTRLQIFCDLKQSTTTAVASVDENMLRCLERTGLISVVTKGSNIELVVLSHKNLKIQVYTKIF
jgi:hypothetical protein